MIVTKQIWNFVLACSFVYMLFFSFSAKEEEKKEEKKEESEESDDDMGFGLFD